MKDLHNKFIHIGKVGKPNGLRGDFHLQPPLNDDLAAPFIVKIGSDLKNAKQFDCIQFKNTPQKTLMLLEQMPSRESIDTLKNQSVWVSRDLVTVDQAEYLWADLEGRQVVDTKNHFVGSIISIENYGASDIAMIKLANTKTNHILVPFIETYFNMQFHSQSDEPIELTIAFDELLEQFC